MNMNRRTLIGMIPALAATPALSLVARPVIASGIAQLIESHTAKRAEYESLRVSYHQIIDTLNPPFEMVLTRDFFTGKPVLAAVERDVELWAAKYRVESLSAQWGAIKEAKLSEVRIHRAKHLAARDAAGVDLIEDELERLCGIAAEALQPILDYVPHSAADVLAVACYLTQDGKGLPVWVEDYEVVEAFQSLAKAVL